MRNSYLLSAAGLLLLTAATSSFGQAGAGFGPQAGDANSLPVATQELLAAYPGVRATFVGANHYLWGKPMTAGATAADAAANFLSAHGDALGVPGIELNEKWSTDLSWGKFTVFAYDQTINGVPVEHGYARVLVLNAETPRVVYAAGVLAQAPAGAPKAAIAPDFAVQTVAKQPLYARLTKWSQPTQVIYMGSDDAGTSRLAWKFKGEIPEIAIREVYTFFVDAQNGRLLDVRDEVLQIDVNGSVMGKATPGTNPDIASNPPVDTPVLGALVRISGTGNSAFTDVNGLFTIFFGGSGTVTVTTTVGEGQWNYIINSNNGPGGPELSASATVTAPGPANLMLNPSPSEYLTAQVNAFIHANITHDYIKDRAPGFTGLDFAIPNTVNLDQAFGITSCNAFFDGTGINFLTQDGGCVNTAYTSVVSHEYGHFIVNQLGLAQGSFGEGFGDSMSMLIYDDRIIGRNFTLTGGIVRDPFTSGRSYPCSGGSSVHFCGELLGRLIWNLRLNFDTKYGAASLEAVRQLHVDWAMVTIGGIGSNSAHPQTAIEMLTVNDDNGDIADGTPDYLEICDAFNVVNIDCPTLSLLDFEYPNGTPNVITPGQTTDVAVNVLALGATPVSGTGQVVYRVDGGAWMTASMTQGAPNQYTATLPAADCGSTVEYYFQAQAQGAGLVTDPADAPASSYAAVSASGFDVRVDDAFEADSGWTVGAAGDTATTGIWSRMDPEATPAQPGDDHTPSGTDCWVTDGRAGSSIGTYDVDGGATTLISPAYDLADAPNATVSYWRWYSNTQGSAPNADVFRVDISNNNGATWSSVEVVGPAGAEANGGWYYHEFQLGDIIAPSANVRLRFIAEDAGSGSIVEAAIDDLRVSVVICDSGCAGDATGDGVVDFDDFSQISSCWGQPCGDVTGDATTDFDDFSLLSANWGCGL